MPVKLAEFLAVSLDQLQVLGAFFVAPTANLLGHRITQVCLDYQI